MVCIDFMQNKKILPKYSHEQDWFKISTIFDIYVIYDKSEVTKFKIIKNYNFRVFSKMLKDLLTHAKWDLAHYCLIILHFSQSFLYEEAKFNQHTCHVLVFTFHAFLRI